MAKYLKCRTCLLANEVKENMECEESVSETSGKVYRMYFHKGECWDKRVAHKAFVKVEAEQLDSLYELIKKLHRIDVVPDKFFALCLQPVRNGNYRQGKKVIKYKNGVSYKMLEETYKHCESYINQAKANERLNFKGSFDELKYCFAIIIDKIPVVARKIKRQMKLDEKIKIDMENMETSTVLPDKKVVYKSKSEDDSKYDFLD